MKFLASLLFLLTCIGCQTNSYDEITGENAIRDFEEGNYRILKYGYWAFVRTEEEQRITEKYGIAFVPVAGDVIPSSLNLVNVSEYNTEMTRLLNEKFGIDLESELKYEKAESAESLNAEASPQH
ncbi:MAG: hypothetical protein AAGH40_02420 [Verrucomicrobiota bacterium]